MHVIKSKLGFVVGVEATTKGATGTSPQYPASRATHCLDRRHWSFDPAGYRRRHLALILAPSAYCAATCVVAAFVGCVLLLVAAGVR